MKTIPTIKMVLEKYPRIAAIERLRTERPCKRTVANTVSGVRRLCQISGIPLSTPVSALDRRRLDSVLDAARLSHLKPVSVWSYLHALRGLFASWTYRYYCDLGWTVPKLQIPVCRRSAPRYVRPDPDVLAKIKDWYLRLESSPDQREWVLATLMLEFAMRNGDTSHLRWSDFRPARRENPVRNDHRCVRDEAEMVLCYTPSKTRLSSGRTVAWPVHPAIWRRLAAYRAATTERAGASAFRRRTAPLVVPCASAICARLNRSLRKLGVFHGAKACYELRKICIDHVYQRYGAESASSISGDDIRTVTHYYADPSSVSFSPCRITDLI